MGFDEGEYIAFVLCDKVSHIRIVETRFVEHVTVNIKQANFEIVYYCGLEGQRLLVRDVGFEERITV